MASPSSRPRTPGKSASPEHTALPAFTDNGPKGDPQPPRRTSLGFLRRTKSGEPLGGNERKTSSGSRTSKKLAKQREEELRRAEAAAIPKQPPKLPDFALPRQIETFGGDDAKPDGVAMITNRLGKGSMEVGGVRVPIPPMPGSPPNYDPYERTESMTHRGRYSYASSAVSTINSPRRVRRRKDPTPFNILIVGARNSGKTSFLNFLRTSLALPPKKRAAHPANDISPPQTSHAGGDFTSYYLETEIEGERVGLTLWDSQGLEKNVVDLQLRDMSSFLESKFEDTFAEERKVVRAPGVRDTHIHCVFLILDPVRLDTNITSAQQGSANSNLSNGKFGSSARLVGGLDEDLDLQVFRTLQGKTTVIPVISKADAITTAHMAFLKKTVSDSLKKANLDPLENLGIDDQDDADGDSGNLDRFDERDEDEAAAKELENAEENTPSTSDSDTVPSAPPVKQPRPTRTGSHKRISSTSSIPIIDTNGTEMPYLPLSILSPDPHSLANAAPGEKVGRQFPWGFADPWNPEHCDFVRLKDSVFTEWRGELREASREVWYERWRTSRLNRVGGNGAKKGGESKRMR